MRSRPLRQRLFDENQARETQLNRFCVLVLEAKRDLTRVWLMLGGARPVSF